MYNIDNLAIHWEPRHQAWVVFCFVVGVSVGGFFRLKLYSTTMNGHGGGGAKAAQLEPAA